MPRKIEQLETLYVGAVAMPLADGDEGGPVGETIFFGERYGVFQASVEHHVGAVAALVKMCDEISEAKGWPWRLLKFDASGIHELDPEEFRDYDAYCQHVAFCGPCGDCDGG